MALQCTKLPSLALLLLLLQLHLNFISQSTALVSLQLNPNTHYLQVETDVPRTASVLWDRVAQQLVIDEQVGPTIASNTYGMLHTAMYNAWSAYDKRALSSTHSGKLRRPKKERRPVCKHNAMSFAAHGILIRTFPKKKSRLLQVLQSQLYPIREWEYVVGKNIGAVTAKAVYKQYSLTKRPKIFARPYSSFQLSSTVIDKWKPERVPIDSQKGPRQTFLTPYWGRRKTFISLVGRASLFRPKPPNLFLLKPGSVNLEKKTISLQNGTVLPVSKSLFGTIINPQYIQQAEHVIKYSENLNERTKLSAEFWEDGKGTSYPPGTWMTFSQYISARDENNMDRDAKMFFMVGNAVRDAGILSWECKLRFSYVRPISAIRSLGKLGLIGHFDQTLNGNVIKAYSRKHGNSTRILASQFNTYQAPGRESSPPFPEYVSGHSSFSASAATVLELFTSKRFFGASVKIPAWSAKFEKRLPSKKMFLTWSTLREAANEAGMSRIYGGIHFKDGNVEGLKLGNRIGSAVYKRSLKLFNHHHPNVRRRIRRRRK